MLIFHFERSNAYRPFGLYSLDPFVFTEIRESKWYLLMQLQQHPHMAG